MTKERELFSSLRESDADLHVKLDDDVKYVVKGEGIVMFQPDLGGLLDVQYVIYIPNLKKNFLLVSTMEDRGFFVTFQRGWVLVRLEKAIPNNTVVVWVREGTLYRLQGKNIYIFIYMLRLWYMIVTTYVSYGTRGWNTYIIGNFQF
jgi:hypothetical protein